MVFFSLALATVLFSPSPVAPAPQGGTVNPDCHWDFHEYTHTVTEYHRTFVRVLVSGFGLWGSTKTCSSSVHVHTHKHYSGPGVPPALSSSTESLNLSVVLSNSGIPKLVATTPAFYVFRSMMGSEPCAGGLLQPDVAPDFGDVRYIGLDGSSFDVGVKNVTGTIKSYIGTAFDSTGFNLADVDPQFVNSDTWPGIEMRIPRDALMRPTLAFTAGSVPGVPLNASMDLANPDEKVLTLSLGAAAANMRFSVLVSSTYQGDGDLGVIDGVTVPLVFDLTTQHFLEKYPELVGGTDSGGRASIAFPMLSSDPNFDYDQLYLSIAVVVHDPDSGRVTKASTYVGLSLQDRTCQ